MKSKFQRKLRASAIVILSTAFAHIAPAQQTETGFALDRLYLSAPGSGWFVMDDLTFGGKLGAAVNLTGNYSASLPSPVSSESSLDVGAAIMWSRYRAYLNLPIPLTIGGTTVNPSSNPDTISDPRIGFDMRIVGSTNSKLRLGIGGQLIFPSGNRSDYDSDARYRGMLRFLAAGDSGAFTWAAQSGIHLRPLHDPAIPGGPAGNEFLFGASAGRKISDTTGWRTIIGPEIFGETAFSGFLQSQQTGVEALLTGRIEQTAGNRRLRLKLGVGHGIVEHFGAPHWRVVAAVELIGQRP